MQTCCLAKPLLLLGFIYWDDKKRVYSLVIKTLKTCKANGRFIAG